MLERDHGRSLSLHANSTCAPRPRGQPSAEGAAHGRVAGSYPLSLMPLSGPGLGSGLRRRIPRPCELLRQAGVTAPSAQALAAASTCANV